MTAGQKSRYPAPMFHKAIAAAALSVTLLPTPSNAQSDPWQATRWIAECVLNENQPDTARVVYAPSRGVYCEFEDFRYIDAPGELRRVTVLTSDVIGLVQAAEFASALYEDWGLIQPDIEFGNAPADAPQSPDLNPTGLVMQLTPEIFDASNPDSSVVGVYRSGATSALEGTLTIEVNPTEVADPYLYRTVYHELFHAVHYSYQHLPGSVSSHWDENWVAEGMADAMANAVRDLYFGPPVEIPPTSARDVPLSAEARLSQHRYTAYEGGLFTTDANATYDTSSFWTHLFAHQLDDMTQVNAMLRAPAPVEVGAPYLIDDWLRNDHARSLPQAYRAFLQDMIRDGTFYDGEVENALLDCIEHSVDLQERDGLRIWDHVRFNGADLRERVRGMGTSCQDYVVDASDGPVIISLVPDENGNDHGPHLQLFSGDFVLSDGETITVPAGTQATVRLLAFLNPMDQVVEPDFLIQRPFTTRFEQSPQSPCNEQTMALVELGGPFTAFNYGTPSAEYMPEYGEAHVDAIFGGATVAGPACMRLILIDYGHADGPALTVQLAHNPSSAIWGNANFAAINVHMEPGSFRDADMRSGRSIVFEQFPSVAGFADRFAPERGIPYDPRGFGSGPEHPFLSRFERGPLGNGTASLGHYLNNSLTLNFEDVGQLSATGTFEFRDFGPFNTNTESSIRNMSASGTFEVPIYRMEPRSDRAAWVEDCRTALFEMRPFDMALCARAHPDPAVQGQVFGIFEIANEWFFRNFLQ